MLILTGSVWPSATRVLYLFLPPSFIVDYDRCQTTEIRPLRARQSACLPDAHGYCNGGNLLQVIGTALDIVRLQCAPDMTRDEFPDQVRTLTWASYLTIYLGLVTCPEKLLERYPPDPVQYLLNQYILKE